MFIVDWSTQSLQLIDGIVFIDRDGTKFAKNSVYSSNFILISILESHKKIEVGRINIPEGNNFFFSSPTEKS